MRDFIRPTTPAKGVGHAAIFTLLDVYGVALFCLLIKKGFSRKVAAEYVKRLVVNMKSIGIELSDIKNRADIFPSIFIFFSKENGKKNIRALTLFAGDHHLCLPSGKLQCVTPVGFQEYEDTGNSPWDNIDIINFVRTREELDAALEKL